MARKPKGDNPKLAVPTSDMQSQIPGRWKKGQSGNPLGGPKNSEALTSVLRAFANKQDIIIKPDMSGYMIAPPGQDGKQGTIARKEALANVLYLRALAGDMVAAKLIYDRVDGTPKQTAEITNERGDSIKITFGEEYNGL